MKKKVLAIFMILIMVLSLTSCSWLDFKTEEIKSDIVGIQFNIDTFDNYGEKTMTTVGKRISVVPNIVSDLVYTNGSWGTTYTESSVLTVIVDGYEMESCGDTMIFYQNDLVPDVSFQVLTEEYGRDDVNDIAIIAKLVNNYKNYFGKKRVVIIKSQMGVPIYAFSGDNVYWEASENLPKFTKLNIDGKQLYIHRANFQIIDTALLVNIDDSGVSLEGPLKETTEGGNESGEDSYSGK